MGSCPFCPPTRPILVESALALAFDDARPVSPGHLLVAPRRHVATYFDCTDEEKAALWALVEQARGLLVQRHHPDGFNVGFNAGTAAGQTVHHAHVHMIPRYQGDVEDPRGGIRQAVLSHSHTDTKRPEIVRREDEPLVEDEGLPIVARLVVEIRSDGKRTVARGALEDAAAGQKVGVRAEGTTPLALAASLAKAMLRAPFLGTAFTARSVARALLGRDKK